MNDDLLLDSSLLNEDELIIEFEKLYTEAGSNNLEKAKALNMFCDKLTAYDAFVQEFCIEQVSKQFKIKKKTLNDALAKATKRAKETAPEPQKIELPEDVDAEEAYRTGFFESKKCYYFMTKDGVTRFSNFVIKPLYHIYSKSNNKRLLLIENEYYDKKVLDVESKVLISSDLFQSAVFGEGHYIIFGSTLQFKRIVDKVSKQFQVAHELRTLGWQREGFWAFSNGIFTDEFQDINEYGITEFKDTKYFLPAFSSIYADVREDDDEYENDRYFIYKPTEVSFGTWAKLFINVYGNKGKVAIAFLIASVFREFIYEKYKIFPHLFLFGEKQSGKSQLAWSLSNVFFDNLPAFNLNSGTQVGFFRRLSRVKNALCWFDEYTNDIDEKRFQALKSAYDGVGHEKGKMSKDNRTEITKVQSACCISGQYLPTRDDNSLLTRSAMLSFEKRTYTDAEMIDYNTLKKLEETGLSSILPELLRCREAITEDYVKVFSTIYDKLKNDLLDSRRTFDERLVRNFATILTPSNIVQQRQLLDLQYDFRDLYDMAIDMIASQSAQISNSEAVASFWQLIEYMLDTKQIAAGLDFKIENATKAITLKNRKSVKEIFDYTEKPTPLIYFRFSKIHPLYMEAHRKQYGKNGVDLVSLTHYIQHHQAFLGTIDSTRFDNTNTSAFVFEYEGLRVNLVRSTGSDPVTGEPTGNNVDFQPTNPKDDLPF